MRRSDTQLKEDILAIWNAGVAAVDSELLVQQNVQVEESTLFIADSAISLDDIQRIVVIGGGKAGAGMAAGFEKAIGEQHIKEKHITGVMSVPADCVRQLKAIKLLPGRPPGQNSPREEGVQATQQMLDLVKKLGPKDLCICLLSGGGSALLPSPAAGISLEEKQQITAYLSEAGANIEQLNTVRKQLSQIKGGGLAQATQHTNLVTLIISDVLGDPLDVIASGPTVPNTTTAADALAVLTQFSAIELPQFQSIIKHLKNKAEISTDQQSNYDHVTNIIIGNNAVAVDAAGIEAERRGYSHAMNCSTQMEGPAEQIGVHLANMAVKMRDNPGPDCLITGGEPVVELADSSIRGLGGRNQQLALAALDQLLQTSNTNDNPAQGLAILSGGTDGEDGPTNAAGAWFNAETINQIKEGNIRVEDFLQRNDAYNFFGPLNRLLITGPTHTNVCDLRVAVVDRVQTPKDK